MDLIDQLFTLSSKIQKSRDFIQTEEATKNAFVLPFISALGYDVFNPMEVVPEFTADVGIKKGEKVDYAIFRDGKPIILFECKKCNSKLDASCASQLYRYFSVTEARIGILTDGITYQFYTDLEEPNKMDAKPYMEFDLLDIQETLIPELKKLMRSSFNLEQTLNAASELKYSKEIRRVLAEELNSPSEEFVRFFTSKVYSGKFTQKVRDQFTDIVKRALHQFIADRINERIKTALNSEAAANKAEEMKEQPAGAPPAPPSEQEEKLTTTVEELEGYYIIKSILRDVIDPKRIAHRDTQSYFGILLDDTNRKPICRLHFNRAQKYLGLFDTNKSEEKVAIETLNDLYNFADRIKATALSYDGMKVSTPMTDGAVGEAPTAAMPVPVPPEAVGN